MNKAIELYENERYEEAFEIFKGYAKKRHAEAEYYMGLFYYEGNFVPQDEASAIMWWKKANRDGSLDAKYMLETICSTSSCFSRA